MKYEPIISDQFYHIYNRGNNGENIFIEEKNYSYFLGLMKKHVTPIADIYAYCLLKNHFHIVLITKSIQDENKISQGISNLFNSFAKAINKTYDRSGSLFQTRFPRKRITNEDYLRAMILYVHLNPKHHGFTTDYRGYPHSSYRALISSKHSELKRTEIINLFEDLDNFIYCHQYRQDLMDNLDETFLLE
ncbi:transposase [Cryomorpha ignava]|uniref:Transposase n=1 Tax=Cryomorpha ignava TaxID=101383 RepID=A0A7K3WM53_9FLAO|nr:transposase [Cryomorpha ignava]NEN22726.1 transposase [Cryomorpha ignava]